MAEPARTSPLAGMASEAVPGPEPVAITTPRVAVSVRGASNTPATSTSSATGGSSP